MLLKRRSHVSIHAQGCACALKTVSRRQPEPSRNLLRKQASGLGWAQTGYPAGAVPVVHIASGVHGGGMWLTDVCPVDPSQRAAVMAVGVIGAVGGV